MPHSSLKDSAMNDPEHPRSDDQRERRIAEIKERLQAIAGGRMVCHESPDMSVQQREEFWERVLACEIDEGPYTTDFDCLISKGIALPPPDSLDDEAVTTKLWEVIRALDELNVLLESTNHLSDRELYTELWMETLRMERPVSDYEGDGDWHVDFVTTGRDEDIRAWLMYYADDETRRFWHNDYPEFDMPERASPPYDRDRVLQALYYEQSDGD
jgi:hypothetical protein